MAKIVTNAPKTDRALEVEYDYGANLEEAKSLFGEQVVYSQYEDSIIIAIQGLVRRNLEKTGENRKSDKEIKEMVAAWKPGVLSRRGDQVEALLKKFEKMNPAKQAALLAALKEK